MTDVSVDRIASICVLLAIACLDRSSCFCMGQYVPRHCCDVPEHKEPHSERVDKFLLSDGYSPGFPTLRTDFDARSGYVVYVLGQVVLRLFRISLQIIFRPTAPHSSIILSSTLCSSDIESVVKESFCCVTLRTRYIRNTSNEIT